MKRTTSFRFSALIIAALISLNSFAQDRSLRLGLTFSPTVNWISPDNTHYDSDGARLGMNYGLIADFRLVGTENYMFHTGFTLSHIGGKMSYPTAFESNGTYTPVTANATYKLRYIDIPLAIKLRTNEIGYMHYYGLFGTLAGFNINAQADYEYGNGNTSFSEADIDIQDDVQLFRSALLIGGGFERNISGNTMLSVGIHYQNGFTNILKGDTYETNANGTVTLDANGKPVVDREWKNNQHLIMLQVGVLF